MSFDADQLNLKETHPCPKCEKGTVSQATLTIDLRPNAVNLVNPKNEWACDTCDFAAEGV